ncbi:sodium:calcium antiporter [Paenarthrobacter sp. DKR-5]|uniref:sodium:calcium antiporter n=1 Tax=Paenarthrobacter sp. DKR-5 TaxID=2835535 RepID=UPI001BDD7D81|nr:sodium:calcium antiporter [Paenarthrobacter sp. DKR-5]MBT1004061.1 sodium:calcium antiporter [Paenarthrobacter sp. DKR-5]
MESLPLALLLLIFVAAAAAIWVAGIQLSKQTDILDVRLHLGSALGGLILLAVATNLPEIAITVTAASSGNVGVAVGNILGGIAVQTVVLVILDLFGTKGSEPLSYRAASLSLVIEAITVIGVLGVVIAGSQMPGSLVAFRLTPAAVLITLIWVLGLILVKRSQKALPWHEAGEAPGSQAKPRGHSKDASSKNKKAPSTGKALTIFLIAAAVTLAAGVLLERSGDAIAGHIGLSGVLFGATFLALATSLPEISTGLASVKQGDYKLAFSDIFGGNAFLPVLFLVAVLISGKPVLPQAQATDIYLTALAILLTLTYILGLVFRPRKKVLGMGTDSLIVLILYILGVAGLFAVASTG